MTGAAEIRAVTAVVSLATRVLAASPGAHTVDRPAAKGRWSARKNRRLRPEELKKLTHTLARRLADTDCGISALSPAVGDLVVTAVEATLAAPVTMDDIQNTCLDPARLRDALRSRAPAPDLPSRGATETYGKLLDACCAHIVEFFTRQPEFQARTAMETARATGDILDRLPRPRSAEHEQFRARYTRGIRPTLDRAQLYGVGALTAEESTYALTTAYVDIPLHTTSQNRRHPDTPVPVASAAAAHDETTPEDVDHSRVELAVKRVLELESPHMVTSPDQFLTHRRRLVLEGPAGSGKTTLLRRLAVRCLDGDHDWGGERTPFLIKLRSFVHDGRLTLPAVEEFTTATGSTLAGEQPSGWVAGRLREGSGMILIDGLDELPTEHRTPALEWIRQLGLDYPDATYVLTSRPGIITDTWRTRLSDDAAYTLAQLRPMTTVQVHECVRRWHRTHARRGGDASELDATAEALISTLGSRRDLSRLATSPLLCALVCALHRNTDRVLPEGRTALYQSALTMMLGGRENARGIHATRVRLQPEQAERLLGLIAHWMTLNGSRSITRDTAHTIIEPQRHWHTPPTGGEPHTAAELLDHLLRRTGLLHEPELDVIEFTHASFQDYLTAWEMVQGRHIGHLIKNAGDPLYHDVVIMAVGRTQTLPTLQSELLRELTNLAHTTDDRALWMLAGAAIADTAMVDPDLRTLVRERTRSFLPPADAEEAYALALAGEFALDLLIDHLDATRDTMPELQVVAIVSGVLSAVGDAAVPLLRRTGDHPSPRVRATVARAVSQVSDRDRYVEDVLLTMRWDDVTTDVDASLLRRWPALASRVTGVTVEDLEPSTIALLRTVDVLRSLKVMAGGRPVSLAPLAELRLSHLYLCDWGGADLGEVSAQDSLDMLELNSCRAVSDLSPLATLTRLRSLVILLGPDTYLAPLRYVDGLESVLVYSTRVCDESEFLPDWSEVPIQDPDARLFNRSAPEAPV